MPALLPLIMVFLHIPHAGPAQEGLQAKQVLARCPPDDLASHEAVSPT